MSRKPNDTTGQTPGDYPQAKDKKTSKKKSSKLKKDLAGGGDEETPVTVSGGSIVIRSVFDREDLDGKKHKQCKIKDTPGKKWTPIRVEIDDDNGIRSFDIVGDGAFVRVIFKRPA
ncbi:MAG TPA: hypothetical protein VM911_03330 [Pyrinomonadaceae bacterium]|jgi:hypothetical protein|nr:hypothetical protein [Pyrinomonadaceae bacterium]